jgi:dihydroorotase
MSDTTITLPKWYDLHAHFRQDELLAPLINAHLAMGCAGVVAMPNTRPPVARVSASDPGQELTIAEYSNQLAAAAREPLEQIIVPLYLTQQTTPAMIEEGARSGLLQACKYYPPHGTTGSEFAQHFKAFMDNGVFAAMEACDLVLCIHGEEHGLSGEAYFGRNDNAEERFYRERMPRLRERFPGLRIVAEHLTSKVGVDFVLQAGEGVAASITPQHLIYTVGHLLQNLKYHLYCLPLVKFDEDRAALRQAVLDPNNHQFFAGTDSAPHATKVTPCGCAAGCFTGGIAPQLYAEALELAGADLDQPQGVDALRRFLVENGAAFYRLPVSSASFRLIRRPAAVTPLMTPAGEITPLPLGIGPDCPQGRAELNWSLEL